MRKITLLLALIAMTLLSNAQVVLIEENFQDWTAQGTSGAYTITKTLADGTTQGTFISDRLIVAPSQSIGSAGTNGGASPTVGRVVIGSTAGYLELPQLPSVGQVQIKANIGTDLRTMKLQVKNGEAFEDIAGTTTEIRKDLILLFTFNLTYSGPTTIRIVTSNSSLNLWDLVVSSYASNLPQVAIPSTGIASDVAAETFVANWTTVPDAVGYEVRVYQGTDLAATGTVSGQSSNNTLVKGLWTNTTYTYKVVAKGDGLTSSDSDESAASGEFTTLNGLTSITTDFAAEGWGTVYTSENQPITGAYPSSFQHGFDIVKSFVYNIPKYDSRGDRKENGIRTDRQSNGGMVILPIVNSFEQIEIHAIPGGAPRDIILKEQLNGVWTTIDTYTMTNTDYKEFIIPLSRSVPTRLRIDNAGSGQVTLFYLATRTTDPALLDAPVVGEATAPNSTYFNANWSTVANATGYKVRVYQATTLVKTVEVSGQATVTAAITELEPATEYTYKVLAVGDGFVTYADSYLSAASAPVTTGPSTSVDNIADFKLVVAGKSIIASERGMFEVYSLQGSKVYQVKNVSAAETNLPKGLYVLQFTHASGKQITQKISID